MKITNTLKNTLGVVVCAYAVVSFLIVGSIAEESGIVPMVLAVLNFAVAALALYFLMRKSANDKSDLA